MAMPIRKETLARAVSILKPRVPAWFEYYATTRTRCFFNEFGKTFPVLSGHVLQRVMPPVYNFKVANIIISLDTIDMVNDFIARQHSPKVGCHDKSMLGNMPVTFLCHRVLGGINHLVSLLTNKSTAFPAWSTFLELTFKMFSCWHEGILSQQYYRHYNIMRIS